MARGGHHRIRAQMGGLNGALHAPPTLNDGTFRQSAFEDLVPPHDAFAVLGNMGAHFVDEGRLELRFVCKPRRFILAWHLGHSAHRTGTSSPPMWMMSDGKNSPLVKHGFLKAMVESFPAQYTSLKTPSSTTGKISVHPSHGAAGPLDGVEHLDLGDDLDVARSGVVQDVENFPGVRPPVTVPCARPAAPHFRELGIGLNGQAPSLVFSHQCSTFISARRARR